MALNIEIIPTRAKQAHWRQVTRLSGVQYILQFDWVQRLRRWKLAIFDNNDNLMISGRVLVPGFDLLKGFHWIPNMPPGELRVIDQQNKIDPAGYTDLGSGGSHLLMYLETVEDSVVEAELPEWLIPGGIFEKV